MKKLVLSAAIAAMFIGGASSAMATSFNLTADHCTGGCGASPFGSVTLTQNGANVDVLVTLFNSDQFVKTGAGDFQNFKFNAVGVVLGDITIDAHTPALVAATGAFSGDGTGSFSFGINCPSCGNGSGAGNAFTNDISFHVANATIADLTVANSDGFIFVADIYSPATGNTGPVAAPGSSVPEPISSALVGSGLLSLFFLRRRASK